MDTESEEESEYNFTGPWSTSQNNFNEKYNKNSKDDEKHKKPTDNNSSNSKLTHQKSFGWEIIEGVLENTNEILRPDPTKGLLYVRRKWPMKGWGKIYISMENGIMAYSKSSNQFAKRIFLREIDLGLAVVTYKAKRQRIDIDSDNAFYHLKVKESDKFEFWVQNIRSHRLYRQWKLMNSGLNIEKNMKDECSKYFPGNMKLDINEQAQGSIESSAPIEGNIKDEVPKKNNSSMADKVGPELVRTLTLAEEANDDIPSSVSTAFVLINEDLKLIQEKLETMAENMDDIKNNVKIIHPSLSASNPSLHGVSYGISKMLSQPNPPDITQLKMIQFTESASGIYNLLQSTFKKLALECDNVLLTNASTTKRESSLSKNVLFTLKELTQQNNDLKSRLKRIKAEASISYSIPSIVSTDFNGPHRSLSVSTSDDYIADGVINRDSRNISTVTTTEMFYDAAEFLESDSASSISETEDIDEISDAEEEPQIENIMKRRTLTLYQEKTGRRDKLPAVQPDISQFSLINLLCKNIGRDLSKVRLPVILNEPLSVLQMLCEELEYSDLLDAAAKSTDSLERMNYLAAFAVSAYASTFYRAGTKPFNPIIGETYEYIRPDKAWKFIAEQVSHHPPISVCYCESDNWSLWQEFRLKNKFWGKSIEAIPTGSLRVFFKKFNETVQWNKVTTCIYNIFGSNRYIEHYGDMNFTSNLNSTAKVTFHKSNSWVHQKFEVTGTISGSDSRKCQLFGKWTEGIYVGDNARCIWRPGAIPKDHDKYYGFTQFAIDLNNIDSDLAATLPKTDSRFRPDQRYLEMGLITEAETEKTKIEELQRVALAKVKGDVNWKPLWFRKYESSKSESYDFTNEYWSAKKTQFKNVQFPILW